MRPDRVIVSAQLLDQNFGLPQTVEDFNVKQFIVEPGVEAFAVAIFQGKPSSISAV